MSQLFSKKGSKQQKQQTKYKDGLKVRRPEGKRQSANLARHIEQEIDLIGIPR